MDKPNYNFFLVLDGMFLMEWHKASCDIYVPGIGEHHNTVATSECLMHSKPLPCVRDMRLLGLPSPSASKCFHPDFDEDHFSLTSKAIDVVRFPCAENPASVIHVPRPCRVFGAHRFAVDTLKMLNTTSCGVLCCESDYISFCERTIFAYEAARPEKVELYSPSCECCTIQPALSIGHGRYMIEISARPMHKSGDHGKPFNALMKKRDGAPPDFLVTALKPSDVMPRPDDPEVWKFGIPPLPKLEVRIDGTGCSAGSVRDPEGN